MMSRSEMLVVLAAGLFAAPTLAVAQASGPTAGDDTDIDEVVVTGLRGSLRAAQEVKREAASVVESITAQDLGKFTDSSVSEALQRLPGVSIEKNVRTTGGGGDGATIRGLGPGFGSSTLNGRELLGSLSFGGGGGRLFDFGSVPPEVLAGAQVYKTSTADRVEPGLAGQVDLATLRPLDYSADGEKIFGSLSLAGSSESSADDYGNRLGGVLGGKFLDDTLGLYVAALSSEENLRRQEYYLYESVVPTLNIVNASGVTETFTNIVVPNGVDLYDRHINYDRKSYSAGVQWKPTDNFELNADYLKSGFLTSTDDPSSYYEATGIFNLDSTNVAPAGSIILGGKNNGGAVYVDTALIGGDVAAQTSTAYVTHFRLRNDNDTENYGINAKWTSDDGRFLVSVDGAHSEANGFFSWTRPYASDGAGGQTIIDNRGGTPQFTVNNSSHVLDRTAYTSFPFNEFFEIQTDQSRDAFRLDGSWGVTDHFTLQAGARKSDTDFQYVQMTYRGDTNATSLQNYFNSDNANVTLPYLSTQVPKVSFDGFCGSNPQFCNQTNRGIGSFSGTFPTSPEGSSDDVFLLDSRSSYAVNEKNTAYYLQAVSEGKMFGLDYSGNLGVRLVDIEVEGFGYRGTETRVQFGNNPVTSRTQELVRDTNQYSKTLPSINLKLMPRDNINVRLGVAQTMSLPDLSLLSPRGVATILTPGPDGTRSPNFASTGNTQLKPLEAINYDVTGEYYTDYGGSYIASLFYKDVSNLIETATEFNQTLPGIPDEVFEVTASFNRGKGSSKGLELGTNQPLVFLPGAWSGLGFQANYTYVDSDSDGRTFTGSSKDNVNVIMYYEKFGFTGRVSYLYRSDWRVGGNSLYQIFADAESTWDASLSQQFGKNFEVIATFSNFTGEDRTLRADNTGLTREFYERSPMISLAVRASL